MKLAALALLVATSASAQLGPAGFATGGAPTTVVQPTINSNSSQGYSSTAASPALVGGIAGGGTDTTISTVWAAFKFSPTQSEIGSILINMKKTAGLTSTSTIAAYLYTDSAGLPSVDISQTSVPETPTGLPTILYGSDIGTGYALIPFRLPQLGLTVSGSYWVVFKCTVSGGNFVFDTQANGSNLIATAADSGGVPGAWTGQAKSASALVLGNAGRAYYGFSENHYAFFGKSNTGFAFRGICQTGICIKGDSVDQDGVGGTSINSAGGRFSSTNGTALVTAAVNGAGAQFVTSGAGSVGLQSVSTTGAAAQLVPTTGLAIDVRDGNAANAQTFVADHDGRVQWLTSPTLPTCVAGLEGSMYRQKGGTSAARTKLCMCTSDGSGTPAYAWQNILANTTGTTTTCP